jgi:hypothetical protein
MPPPEQAPKPSAASRVMEAVHAKLEERRRAALERVAAVRAAVDAYVDALEREALDEILKQVGAPSADAPAQSAKQAAKAIRSAVEQLPELAEKKLRDEKKPAPKPEDAGARAPRPRVPSPPGLTAKLQLPAALKAKTQKAAAGATGAVRTERRKLPALQLAAERRKVVIVGGLVKQDKLRAVTAELGFLPEWIETDGAKANAIRGVEGRILDGRIAGVVVLEGVMSHTQVEPLVRATRQTGTPFAYADRGGKASLDRALEELDEALLDADEG